jgi:tetratricopeptide (TPR) repeat protein
MSRRDEDRRNRPDAAAPVAADAIGAAIDAALARILSPGRAAPASRGARRLERLFAELARAPAPPRARELEALIWALWTNHADPALDATMAEAIDALVRREHARARTHIDRLVDAAPDWPEAWNKRATLAFVEGRDLDSLLDIARALEGEPRHFGAIAGLGQICLRLRRPREALAAFDVALRIHPRLGSLAQAAAALRRDLAAAPLN